MSYRIVLISIASISGLIGLLCMTCGYLANKNYNEGYRQTTCKYTAYNFRAFPWNNWDCKKCTAYYASITTVTEDGIQWETHQAIVYPPGNSVERQTSWYTNHWPIGTTVICWDSDHGKPIFTLADVDGTFWSGIAFLSLTGLNIVILVSIISFQLIRQKCSNYSELKNIVN